MDFVQAIILSIVEGLSEFLPISSTGHLILASDILKIPQTDFVKSFEIIIQLGAILAVVVLYFKTLLNRKNWANILAAFIPTAVVGFTLYKYIKGFLIGNTNVVLISLFIGGILLILFELVKKKESVGKIENLTLRQSFVIGLYQSVSVIPGVSRSAATIIGALLIGAKRTVAVEFSFLLAVPTMIAATGLDLIKSNFAFSGNEYMLLLVGLLGSFIVAIFAVKFLLQFIQTHTFIPFGIYRIILAFTFWWFIIR